MHANPSHPRISRRTALQAGAVGLLGLGMGDLAALPRRRTPRKARACIYIFLSGGLAQHDSFDPKPDAPDGIRGEFRPIATRTPGVRIVEHLPMLAAAQRPVGAGPLADAQDERPLRSATCIMLTGRSTTAARLQPEQAAADRLARPSPPSSGRRSRPAQQPAARRRPAGPDRPQQRPGHPRPVRRAHGPAPRPVVHRGVAVRPARLRGLPRVRVRPPEAALRPQAPASGGCPASTCRRRSARRASTTGSRC